MCASVARLALAEVVSQAIVDACGTRCTGLLPLARVQVCSKLNMLDLSYCMVGSETSLLGSFISSIDHSIMHNLLLARKILGMEAIFSMLQNHAVSGSL